MPWLELMLLASWVLMLAWYPCCCSGGGVPGYDACTYCLGSGDNSPQYVTMTISGVANTGSGCTSCGDYNGTWVLEIGDPCIHTYWITDSGCGCATRLYSRFWWSSTPGNYRLSGMLHIMCTDSAESECGSDYPPAPDTEYNAWSGYNDSASKTDCLNLDSESIGNLSASNNGGSGGSYPCTSHQCDFSSATMAISSGDVS